MEDVRSGRSCPYENCINKEVKGKKDLGANSSNTLIYALNI